MKVNNCNLLQWPYYSIYIIISCLHLSLEVETPSTAESRQAFEIANGSINGITTLDKNTGFKLFRQRWWAMFVKKLIHSRRYKFSLISQLLMPCLFTMLALIVVKSFPKLTDEPSIMLSPNMFGSETYSVYSTNNDARYII